MIRRLIVGLVAGCLLAAGTWSATAVGSATNGRGSFTDDDGSVHEPNINGLAASGVSKGCNPPDNTRYCPERAVTRAEMATFLVRGLGDLEPILNTISMRTGLSCTKDGVTCSGRATLAAGVQLEAVEGWHQALPYLGGEEETFKSGGTRVDFSWDGSTMAPVFLGDAETASLATRRWRVRPPSLTPGNHTLRAVWRWSGSVTQTASWTITVPSG